MHRTNKRESEDVVTLPPFVAVVVVVVPTLATFGALELEQALRAIDATTTRAAKPPHRRCFDVVARLASSFRKPSLRVTCSLRGQSGDGGNCRVRKNVNENACDVAVTCSAVSTCVSLIAHRSMIN
jgi:TPP-dependent indolepyruvate ferredoxin oxidoreductase alpha subunit